MGPTPGRGRHRGEWHCNGLLRSGSGEHAKHHRQLYDGHGGSTSGRETCGRIPDGDGAQTGFATGPAPWQGCTGDRLTEHRHTRHAERSRPVTHDMQSGPAQSHMTCRAVPPSHTCRATRRRILTGTCFHARGLGAARPGQAGYGTGAGDATTLFAITVYTGPTGCNNTTQAAGRLGTRSSRCFYGGENGGENGFLEMAEAPEAGSR